MLSEREKVVFVLEDLSGTDFDEERLDLLQRLADITTELNTEEQHVFYSAYKTVINNCRDKMCRLDSVIDQQRTIQDHLSTKLLEDVRNKLKDRINSICDKGIESIREFLMNCPINGDVQLFYYRVMGDFYRYKCETAKIEQLDLLKTKANRSYAEALKIMKAIDPPSPFSFSVSLNYAVFLADIMKQKRQAIEIAQYGLDSISCMISENQEEMDMAKGIQLQLEKNITLWSRDEGDL